MYLVGVFKKAVGLFKRLKFCVLNGKFAENPQKRLLKSNKLPSCLKQGGIFVPGRRMNMEKPKLDMSRFNELFVNANKQEAKADAGKPKLTLVPRKILTAVARVREYGCEKYGDPENWKLVDRQRYKDAAFRHFLSYLDDPDGTDEESGLPHLWHLACNIAFLCEMEENKNDL